MSDETTRPDVEPDESQDRAAGPSEDALVNLTQAQLNALISNEKARERRKIAEKYGDLDELAKAKRLLDEKRQAELSEAEKLQERIAALEREKEQQAQQVRLAELKALRLRVGQELGLPPKLAEKLTGEDEDALRLDAQSVIDALKTWTTGGAHIPDIDGSAGAGAGPSKPKIKLTPSQQEAARRAGWTDEKYIASLLKAPDQ